MTVVADNDLESILQLIKDTVRTGEHGDGKIFITNIDECIRIRTDETGESAL